jgi:hypothetical protein
MFGTRRSHGRPEQNCCLGTRDEIITARRKPIATDVTRWDESTAAFAKKKE